MIYEILDENNNVVNTIRASESFVAANYTNYREYVAPVHTVDNAVVARADRDGFLQATDWVVPVTDHPRHAEYLTYRQALRDVPSQAGFPDNIVWPTQPE